ncbi:MAG: aspartyl protease family protein [Lachnospiraceae bacterium]|nr:aspartyl protease family protein [Lachnospiraceae bacterium]
MIDCVAVYSMPQIVTFVLDTGAKYTCCRYEEIDDTLREEDFHTAETKLIGGIVNGPAVRLYACNLHQFSVGNIDLGARKIWISFDERLSDSVLGLDILKHALFLHDPAEKVLSVFESTEELKDSLS